MLQDGLVGFLPLQIEIVIGPPPRPRPPHRRLITATFFPVIAIHDDASPCEIRPQSCRIRMRSGMRTRSFNGEDFWEGNDGEGDEEEVGNWKGWRRRRRRRRNSEKGAVLEEFWMFKVLRPYGWSLPLILLSWLAASGPKAFFISLALSFALSAAALAVRFLWPVAGFDSQGSVTKRKRRSAGRASRSRTTDDEKRSGQKRTSAYDSWLKSDLGLEDTSFGGWANLEEERFVDELGPVIGKQRKGKTKSGRESTREANAEAEAPLLLRLLVAMFPFMASWTKLFW